MNIFFAIAFHYTDNEGCHKVKAFAIYSESEEAAIGSAFLSFGAYNYKNILGYAVDHLNETIESEQTIPVIPT